MFPDIRSVLRENGVVEIVPKFGAVGFCLLVRAGPHQWCSPVFAVSNEPAGLDAGSLSGRSTFPEGLFTPC